MGGGVLLTLSPNTSWSAVCCVVICMCSLFSSPRSSATRFIKLSISVICSVLSSVLRSVLLLLAQQGWETPVMALQSEQGSVRGRGALHILQCCQQAPVGWLQERSEWEPGSFFVWGASCSPNLPLALVESNQISMSNLRQEIQAEGMSKVRGFLGDIPRHVCLLQLGEPSFGAHLHCLSEKCKACGWWCRSPTAALGGTLICEEMWNYWLTQGYWSNWDTGKMKQALARGATWDKGNELGLFSILRELQTVCLGEAVLFWCAFLQDRSFQSWLVLGRTVRIKWKVSWIKLFMMGKLGNRELEGLPEYARLLHGGCWVIETYLKLPE